MLTYIVGVFYHVSTIAKTPTAAAGDWQLSLDLPGLHQGQPRAHGGGKKCWDYTGDDDHLRGIS